MVDADRARDTLVGIVESAAGVDLDASDAAVTRMREGERSGPIDEVGSSLADAGSVVGVIPRIDPALVDRLTATDAPQLDARIVLTGRAAERGTGPAGAAIASTMAERGVTLSVHGGDSPVGVLLVDDGAVVGVFDGPTLAAVLTTDRPAVREWAAATCRRYIAAADRI